MDVPDYAVQAGAGKKKDDGYKPVPVQDTIIAHEEVSRPRERLPVGGVLTIIGGFLVCLSFGSDFSYPNINTYLTSYMRENGYNDNLGYVDFVFLTTTKMVIQGAAMPWLGRLARKMGPKISVAVGSAIYSGGYLLTYLTVQYHFSLAILSLSLHGIAFCFVYATTIRAAQAWFSPARKGLVASIVVSGYGFGSSLWAPIQTGFVNPDNLKAGHVTNCSDEILEAKNCTETGQHKYFTDPAVLNRVPLMFIVLGSIYAVMGVIAVILIAEPKEELHQDNDNDNDKEERVELKENARKNLSPSQVLKTSWFYQLWSGFFSISLTIAIMGNYSKTFGFTFINDDHFYSIVAIFQNILNGFSRIFWGFSYDRYGFKKCFSVICVVVCITITTLPILPNLGDSQGGRTCYALR
jgi:MFS family permease